MHTAGLDNHDVAGLPVDAAPVMDIVAVSLDDVEDGAVQMAVLLAECARPVSFDMGLDRLSNGRRARRNAGLAEMLRPALPRLVAERQHARLTEQILGQLAIGAFQGTHEGALFLPALPYDWLLAIVGRRRGVCVRGKIFHRRFGQEPTFEIRDDGGSRSEDSTANIDRSG